MSEVKLASEWNIVFNNKIGLKYLFVSFSCKWKFLNNIWPKNNH